MKSIIKILFYIISKCTKVYVYLINYLILHHNKVVCGLNLSINGKILIKNKGHITLGSNVLINNSSTFNEVGISHPTILCTQNKDATIEIGNNVGISGSSIVAAKSITIGDRVLIGGGVGIWDTDFHPLDPIKRNEDPTRDAVSLPIHIGNDVFIGARSIILKGVTIGNNVVIGAGSVVSKDVPEGTIAYGNPLIIKYKK
jgi:acetyltransferase-like isoleucine patch superfamily enzyme